MNSIREALGWMAFPLVPVVLASVFHETANLSSSDPRAWDWLQWVIMSGPLVGYGFLAGATIDLPDDPAPRRWLTRRSVWVAVGPWSGFLVCAGVFWTMVGLHALTPVPTWDRAQRWLASWNGTWTGWATWWAFGISLVALLGYAWLLPAVATLRRARGVGQCVPACRRGLAVALVFVGSLFGSFWAITESWRSYFFDPRVAPFLLAALSLAALSGCGNPTYGEVRRRELFHAMLMAWVLGLALLWRWWGRPRGPKG